MIARMWLVKMPIEMYWLFINEHNLKIYNPIISITLSQTDKNSHFEKRNSITKQIKTPTDLFDLFFREMTLV